LFIVLFFLPLIILINIVISACDKKQQGIIGFKCTKAVTSSIGFFACLPPLDSVDEIYDYLSDS
tara:strand:+ start:569 stop:760 length:192 start_codon:yes stop_codon:yes gene_type:complete